MKIDLHSDELSSEWIEVTQEQLNLYAEASGDHNVIHLDEAEAKKVGLPGVIAHGMYIAGLMGTVAQNTLKTHWPEYHLSMMRFRFKNMTFLKEKVQVTGKIKKEEDKISLNLNCVNEAGEVKTQSSVTLEKL